MPKLTLLFFNALYPLALQGPSDLVPQIYEIALWHSSATARIAVPNDTKRTQQFQDRMLESCDKLPYPTCGPSPSATHCWHPWTETRDSNLCSGRLNLFQSARGVSRLKRELATPRLGQAGQHCQRPADVLQLP
eukprot:2071122-Amphidinium_carterae.2